MKKTKFTLIELLVVVAIIGILASILMPSLAKARNAAILKVCMNNQRQVAVTAAIYATDFNGYVIGDNFGNKASLPIITFNTLEVLIFPQTQMHLFVPVNSKK